MLVAACLWLLITQFVFVFIQFMNVKEWLVSLQETVDGFAARVSAAGVELTDSFSKVVAEIQGLKDQLASVPGAEVVDFSGLDAAVVGVESAAVAFDGLEPPVVEDVPVDSVPVEEVPVSG